MKKEKQQQNYLDLIPERKPELVWNTDDKGIIVLEVENTGIFNHIAQKLFKKPEYTKVHMEKYGSFLWPLIDGKRTVTELAGLLKAQFGNEVEPLYPRIVKYMQIMESYHFIRMKKNA